MAAALKFRYRAPFAALPNRLMDTTNTSRPVIDTHAHALPVSLLTEIAGREVDGISAVKSEHGWHISMPGAPEPILVRPAMTDSGRRSVWAARQGLTAQIVSPWLDIHPTPAMPEAATRSWARRLNAALAQQEAGSNHVLGTVALTPHAARDLVSAVDQDGMAGLILSTSPPGVTDLADATLEALWETAAGLGIPVMLHPPTDGPARALPDSSDFGNTFCRLVDTTFAVTKIILSGVLDRHPTLRLIAVHGGGFLPYQSMRLDGGHMADRLSRYVIQRDRPSDYVSDLFFDTVAMKAESIRFLASTVGADHILLGSDYPFAIGDRDPVATVRKAELGENATAAVLGGNAARLFQAVA